MLSRKRSMGNRQVNQNRFTMSTLRGIQQPDLSKRLFRLIKTENHAIDCLEGAGRDRVSVASQLSDWGESTGDYAVSDLSDKLGVLLAEIGEQEDLYAQNLDDYRNLLKQIRNTEAGVQPAREYKQRVIDEIQKQKIKDPQSARAVTLEQELVRAEAQALVAEAQLTNITRQKLKEAYDLHLASTIERAEKQIILARHGRRLLTLLDDTPLVPGDTRPTYEHYGDARRVLDDAEQDLRTWEPSLEPVRQAGTSRIGNNLMPNTRHSAGDLESDGEVGDGYQAPQYQTTQYPAAAATETEHAPGEMADVSVSTPVPA